MIVLSTNEEVKPIMTQYSESQQHLAQQQQTNQIQPNQTAIAETAFAPSLGQADIPTLVETGGIPAAIILCLAIFLWVLAEYNKVFLLAIQKPDEKEDTISRLEDSQSPQPPSKREAQKTHQT